MRAKALAAAVFVPYEAPLQAGVLIDRRDRFIASVRRDVEQDTVEAHCINPGRMEAFVEADGRVRTVPASKARTWCMKLPVWLR